MPKLDRRNWLTGVGAAGVGLFAAHAVNGAPTPNRANLSEKEIERLWIDLEDGEPEASRAILKLAAHPQQTEIFLKVRLKPLKISAKQVEALIAKLGSDKEEIYGPAFEELEYFDPRLAIDLETLMANFTETPARQRMVAVLSGRAVNSQIGKEIKLHKLGNGEGFNFMAGGSWWAEHRVSLINQKNYWGNLKKKWTRATRTIALLEHFGTPESIAILKDMATGHAEAAPTVAAKAAVERIAGK